jgi:hypothetical protein
LTIVRERQMFSGTTSLMSACPAMAALGASAPRDGGTLGVSAYAGAGNKLNCSRRGGKYLPLPACRGDKKGGPT